MLHSGSDDLLPPEHTVRVGFPDIAGDETAPADIERTRDICLALGFLDPVRNLSACLDISCPQFLEQVEHLRQEQGT